MTYDSRGDLLAGVYFQAAMGRRFDVDFVRKMQNPPRKCTRRPHAELPAASACCILRRFLRGPGARRLSAAAGSTREMSGLRKDGKMRMRLSTVALGIALAGLLAGCAGKQMPPLEAYPPIQAGPAATSRQVDTFVVVLDTASSMERDFQTRRHSELARDIVARMNRVIPSLDYRAALLEFSEGSCVGCDDALVLYGPALYRRDEFAAALAGYRTTGPERRARRMGGGTEASRVILQGNPGRVALIFVSDAENILHGRAFKAVQKLQGALGSRLCIYAIQVDRDRDGRTVMDTLVKVGGCGFTVNVDDISAPEAMDAYVKRVFLAPAAIRIAGAPVLTGPDSDGDGVPDSRDKCPDTPRGATVDADGCWEVRSVYFDSDQAVIKDPRALEEAVLVFKADPRMAGEVQGHTDSTASMEHNQKLSEARAAAVRDYFTRQGLAPERIRTRGFGETRPAASNDTFEGRALNRRAELQPDRR
jgi:OmpA-OmpF porin, OOP family